MFRPVFHWHPNTPTAIITGLHWTSFIRFTLASMSVISLNTLSRDAQRLLSLTDALMLSGSHLEDGYWEGLLTDQLEKIIGGKKNKTTESALEYLSQENPEAYEILFEIAESLTESIRITRNGITYDALLFSAPIIAWTRYTLPDGQLSDAQATALQNALKETIIASGARIALAQNLLNFDVMPQSFHETRTWTQQLAEAALDGKASTIGADTLPNSDGIMADTRFIIGVIVVPQGQPLFQWQVSDADAKQRRRQCQDAWARACGDILAPMFTGCHTEYLGADAYYNNNREADHRIRPLVIRAAITWLHTAVNIDHKELRAVIVGCGDTTLQEYRVGFSVQGSKTVIYGCLWPVLSKEEMFAELIDTDSPTTVEEITAILKEEGVNEVRKLPGLHPCEYCEDCGAPYFPDMLGEMHHPELPDETSLEPVLFH